MLIFYYPNKNPTSPVSDIETHLHTTSLVFCFMFCLSEVLSLAVSKLKKIGLLLYNFDKIRPGLYQLVRQLIAQVVH